MVLDHFGGRTLNLPLCPSAKQIEENKSVLSILADSNDVELILITCEDIAYLPNFEREALTKKLTEHCDSDRPFTQLKNIKKMKDEKKSWDMYKVELSHSKLHAFNFYHSWKFLILAWNG